MTISDKDELIKAFNANVAHFYVEQFVFKNALDWFSEQGFLLVPAELDFFKEQELRETMVDVLPVGFNQTEFEEGYEIAVKALDILTKPRGSE